MFDWCEIKKEYETAVAMSVTPENLRKYREGEIIDEEMSVRWNREEVERRNEKYAAKKQELVAKRRQRIDKITDEVVKYIASEVPCSEKKAQLIWDKAYDDGHACGMCEIEMYVESYIEFAQAILA